MLTPRRIAPLVGVVVVGAVVLLSGALSRAGTEDTTVTIPSGGGSAPSLTVRAPVLKQSAGLVDGKATAAGATAATVAVSSHTDSQAMPAGFVGLSMEYNAVEPYAAAGSLFDQALENLDPAQRPYIRVGGDSADHSTVPVPGFSSTGVNGTWGVNWEAAAKGLATGADAHMVFDLDMEANTAVVPIAEERTMLTDVGAKYVSAFELGNEPDLYPVFPWYKTNGTPVYARSKSTWTPAAYVKQLKGFVGALDGVALWGPALGDTSKWWPSLSEIAAAVPDLSQITDHAYPLNCYGAKSAPTAPSVTNLLAPTASVGLAQQVAPEVAFAKQRGVGVRIDEINTVACAGHDSISNFASALWALEAGYAMDKAGVSGIDIHTFPQAAYRLFTFAKGSVTPADEYYGWMLFARANPPGSHQLATSTSGNSHLHAFATKAGSATNVTLINDSANHSATVTLSVPASGHATVEPLRSPSLTAKDGATFAGLSIDPSTGRLSGTPTVSALGGDGRYTIWLPPASADLVTVTR